MLKATPEWVSGLKTGNLLKDKEDGTIVVFLAFAKSSDAVFLLLPSGEEWRVAQEAESDIAKYYSLVTDSLTTAFEAIRNANK